jgi:polyribonucleotide nucleotidyltransferase
MDTTISPSQEKLEVMIKTGQEMRARIKAGQAEMKAIQEKMEAAIKISQEEMKATVKAS